MREPDELGLERAHPQLALRLRLVELDEANRHVTAGDDRTRARLDGDQTMLVWEARGMPLELLSAYGAGVQIHVEDLADYLARRERRDDAKARWDQLHPHYQHLATNLG